jgi:hypothetical protein
MVIKGTTRTLRPGAIPECRIDLKLVPVDDYILGAVSKLRRAPPAGTNRRGLLPEQKRSHKSGSSQGRGTAQSVDDAISVFQAGESGLEFGQVLARVRSIPVALWISAEAHCAFPHCTGTVTVALGIHAALSCTTALPG